MNVIPNYFDLNKRAAKSVKRIEGFPIKKKGEKDVGPLSTQEKREPRPAHLKKAPKMPLWQQLLLYLGIVIGVVFSSAVMQFKSGQPISLNISLTTIFISIIVGLIIIPLAFERLNVKPDSPLIVRFGLFVQHGVFWQVILGLIGKALIS
jgi:hypothetical protein